MKNNHGKCVFSDYQIQKNDGFFASYVLYIISSTKVLGIDFKPAVLNLDYQKIIYCWRLM